MKIGYARVSTFDQNLDLQIDALTEAGCEKIFAEKVSTREKVKPERNKLLENVRKDDTIIVYKLDRLARNLTELVELVNGFDAKGIHFKSLKETIDTSTATGRLIFHMFAAMAEFERDLTRERVQAGMESARARGRLGGRKPSLNAEEIKQLRKMYQDRQVSIDKLCALFKIKRTTLYKYIKKRDRPF